MSENMFVPELDDVPTTPEFDFLAGAFNLNSWRVPYFTSTLTVSEVAKFLKMPSELPGIESIDWKVDELYQRDIDWARVETGLVKNYLSDSSRPHFFNSITIALLPFDGKSNERKESFDENLSWDAPKLSQQYGDELTVGPIQFGFFQKDATLGSRAFRLGRFKWNPRQVFGVAIDGQHRLAAMKILAKRDAASLDETQVPVIFLVFDERLGFENPGEKSTVEMLRQLFIDLNKHAKTVNRARQILLDDRDAHSVCVRQIMGEMLSSTLDDLKEVPPRLPLAIVDWHSEGAKFERGPYLTTVLGLDWIVGEILGKVPKDYMAYGSIRKYLGALERQLHIELPEARERVNSLEEYNLSPFSFDEKELERIRSAFAVVWSPTVSHVFTEFMPYKELLELRVANGSLSREFQHWWYLNDRASNNAGQPKLDLDDYLSEIESRRHEPIPRNKFEKQELEIQSSKGNSIAFNVVFQKALFLAFMAFTNLTSDSLNIDDELYDDEEYEDAEDTDGATSVSFEDDNEADVFAFSRRNRDRAEIFVDAINRVIESFPSFLDIDVSLKSQQLQQKRLWAGSLRNSEGLKDFTAVASKRAHGLILLLVGMVLFADGTADDGQAEFDDYWDGITDGSTELLKVLRVRRNYWVSAEGGGGRITIDYLDGYDEDIALEELEFRLREVWEKMSL